MSRAAWLRELAAELSAPASGPWGWSDEEARVCKALALSALRQRDLGKLEEAAKMFGGLPAGRWGKDEQDLLWVAAGDPQAFGFGAMVDILQPQELARWSQEEDRRVAEGVVQERKDELWALGAWLRSGLVEPALSPMDLDEDRPSAAGYRIVDGARSLTAPVGAALSCDCPAALAEVLADPRRFEALAALEPGGSMDAGAERLGRKAARDMARANDARMESTLLWQAVGARAWRCAAMLARIPEFSKGLIPGRLGWSAWGSFARAAGEDTEMNARSSPRVAGVASLPGWVVESLVQVQNSSYVDERSKGMERWLTEAAKFAPPQAKALAPDGSGWAGSHLSWIARRGWRMDEQQKAAAVIELTQFYEGLGFELDAGACAAMFEKTAPEAAQWLMLRHASKGEGAPKKAGPKAL